MESNAPQAEAQANQTQKRQSDLNTESPGALAQANTAEAPSTDQPWREWLEPVLDFLSKLPNYLERFFYDYKQPLVTLGLILAAIVTLRITFAVLDAINGIPLLAPLFELVGLGYGGWFTYRYLLRASNRKELGEEFNNLKEQVVGEQSQQS
ncbi:MAG: hypothetical protein BRC41_07565 [Cyanobacteria bacterium QH_9_48_43]|nr:MAG: hypothetical protein BRC44_13435 [Cyanobacteria bacterium QS_4_48_99]PSO86006.1 MAG: hypothetical protein BRC41_07565 [Cyanobacteria bacterium QH_9_48_43]PSO86430.1 MAG: hypothetical protein BRC43_11265 [Cyanobacteria bacterium QS_3_48_167]PSP02486.1 MAG: hypothetical protein BRC51_11660 [Cyanobacteria bacterium SW_12_48_29]PSP05270.1 MAG: hypothetical protein BRC54_09575 [Cyanobacteria bacterium SW_7_48_12]PSP20411.1 MAG: hypothetical protein BRC52_08620 [Cyanobacteria bacterium SW_5_